jgi:hypothetical protein
MVILDTVDAEPMKRACPERRRPSTPRISSTWRSRGRGKLIVVADVGYFERRAAGIVVTRMIL